MMAPESTVERQFFVHPHALVETDEIGAHTRIWAFAHVMAGVRIGSDCNIGDHCFIEAGVRLGNGVTMKNGVSIWQGVEIQDNVFLGPNCVFTNDPNPRAYIKKSSEAFTSTHVSARCTIGANATIVCGVTIGQYAFVGAGTVVIRDVPDFALVVGNPGRQIGWMCICATKLSKNADMPRSFACDACGRKFTAVKHALILQDAARG
jgi:UDP-2-acetamido-3-amino-2,3-dideoxy-glucuronate N-acetyltransferase